MGLAIASGITTEDLPHYTWEEYQHWEGDWELIRGIPYAMAPAPVKIHQQLIGYLFSELSEELDECPVCDVLLDEDWKLDSETILKPDVAVVCHDNNPAYISKTPDLIFEVISPSTARHDEGLKYRIYAEAGVQFYVLVYPEGLLARVFTLQDGQYKKAAECDTENFEFEGINCPVTVDFAKVFKRFRK